MGTKLSTNVEVRLERSMRKPVLLHEGNCVVFGVPERLYDRHASMTRTGTSVAPETSLLWRYTKMQMSVLSDSVWTVSNSLV